MSITKLHIKQFHLKEETRFEYTISKIKLLNGDISMKEIVTYEDKDYEFENSWLANNFKDFLKQYDYYKTHQTIDESVRTRYFYDAIAQSAHELPESAKQLLKEKHKKMQEINKNLLDRQEQEINYQIEGVSLSRDSEDVTKYLINAMNEYHRARKVDYKYMFPKKAMEALVERAPELKDLNFNVLVTRQKGRPLIFNINQRGYMANQQITIDESNIGGFAAKLENLFDKGVELNYVPKTDEKLRNKVLSDNIKSAFVVDFETGEKTKEIYQDIAGEAELLLKSKKKENEFEKNVCTRLNNICKMIDDARSEDLSKEQIGELNKRLKPLTCAIVNEVAPSRGTGFKKIIDIDGKMTNISEKLLDLLDRLPKDAKGIEMACVDYLQLNNVLTPGEAIDKQFQIQEEIERNPNLPSHK